MVRELLRDTVDWPRFAILWNFLAFFLAVYLITGQPGWIIVGCIPGAVTYAVGVYGLVQDAISRYL